MPTLRTCETKGVSGEAQKYHISSKSPIFEYFDRIFDLFAPNYLFLLHWDMETTFPDNM